ncbi:MULTISPECIES: murein L,D-transpeptidase catalytic domain family protein [unclassified Sphingomonas]|uniref:murein L,D-transpeptidase catalytic domain family protein n=1 Tax=unclassified Sphingomonas TaxID=196159 RepID=UPI001D121B30|nr:MULTISPECIES: murein L,D-transpeptidase catalytic domain family protein [unclassified Sphingomonas]MCC2980398.1 murein L,D-transpeptidase catalytic domain family protein [Sphingomonas sp. IC4-52]MCD2316503.1 murein L,D-transpeptidase catalytic domain family protein [Sphingomonas sp. IC-11]
MAKLGETAPTRRGLLKTAGALAGAMVVPDAVSAAMRAAESQPRPLTPSALAPVRPAPRVVPSSPRVVRPDLMRQALAALERHGNTIKMRDRIVIADFSAPSSQRRFHFIDLVSGKSVSKLVAHGSGSDPSHTGYLQRFSNLNGSNASCEGAFLADNYYVGKHGKSQRLIGLDPTNNNALARAIVVHGAWYSNEDMLRTHGRLGRSQGCFAVGERELAEVFERLGQGRMIYAAKV